MWGTHYTSEATASPLKGVSYRNQGWHESQRYSDEKSAWVTALHSLA